MTDEVEKREHVAGARRTDPAECTPDEVTFVVSWGEQTPTVLKGTVSATNVGRRAWRITGKPRVRLIAADGRQLRSRHVSDLVGRARDWVVVQPGETVTAAVSFSQWDGSKMAAHLVVIWPGGEGVAMIDGPVHPSQSDQSGLMYTSSRWFEPPRPPSTRTEPRYRLDRDGRRRST